MARKSELWSAYIDGELSAAEALEFDSGLTAEQRNRVAAEMKFEDALSRRLVAEPGCPDDVWARIKEQLATSEGADVETEATPAATLITWRPWALAAAAAVVVLLAFPLMHALDGGSDQDSASFASSGLLDVAPSVAALRGEVQMQGSEADVAGHLADFGFALSIAAVPESAGGHRGIHFLGASERNIDGERVVELMWECCGEPVTIAVAHRGSRIADRLLAAGRDGDIQHSQSNGGYVLGLVSDHYAKGMLNLVKAG